MLGTFVVITAYGPDQAWLQQSVSAAFAEIRRVDALMSLHRPDSELVRLNARAVREAVPVSEELFQVLAQAQEIARETEGAFDITIGPLADLWGFIRKEYSLPNRAEVSAALPRVNYRLIELDPKTRTVRFLAAGVSLDLGGIAKGYAVDCAVEQLHALGVSNVLVRAGGDLRVSGAPPDREHWAVQIEDPAKRGRRAVIPLRDAAVSTSGNYENFFQVEGRRYSHILDPRTGWPVPGLASCSVIASTCLESDAWATACFVYGVAPSLAAFGSRFGLRFVLMPDTATGDWPVRKSVLFPEETDD